MSLESSLPESTPPESSLLESGSLDSSLLDSASPRQSFPMYKDSLHSYLDRKGLEYAPFDPERMPSVFALVRPFLTFSPHIVHILGTNGKGSTGRFIALHLLAQGHSVLHFSSPHLFSFNERFYINGTHVGDRQLERAHEFLQNLGCENLNGENLGGKNLEHENPNGKNLGRKDLRAALESTSYFEYATLLALVLAQECEYFICEAGLGGEFDSTSVVRDMAEASVFTPISYDHTELLGDSIESIASTKLAAMGKHAFLAPQRYKAVESIAREIAKDRGAELTTIAHDEIDSAYASSPALREWAKDLAPFLRENLIVARKVLETMGALDSGRALDSGISGDQAVPFGHRFDLLGRAQKLAPNLLLDVGHNAECARAVVEIVGQKRVNLVYNSFSQKDVREILGVFRPVVDRLFIMPITHHRALPRHELIEICDELGITYQDFTPAELGSIAHHDHTSTDNNKIYVVFGSFSVVEAFLEMWNARR